jgi:translation initiation factor IF-2
MSLEDFFSNAQETTGKKMLKLVIRADVQGSAEAIKNAVENLGNNEVGVEVLVCGVGPINDNDVALAVSSKAYILGFNMRPNTSARKIAEDKGVDVKTYSIIYELIDDVTKALEGLLAPERIEKYIGRATVKETFNIPKVGTIAGSSVIDGKIQRACNIRLLRNGKIIHDGKLATLKRFKDEVKEVSTGYECGIALENFNDVQAEDIFEAYIMEEKKRTLEQNSTL